CTICARASPAATNQPAYRHVRLALDEGRGGLQQHVRALEPLEAPHEADHLRGERDSQGSAGVLGGALGAGGELLDIGPGGDHRDASLMGVVTLLDVRNLGLGVDDADVGVVYDLLLAAAAG